MQKSFKYLKDLTTEFDVSRTTLYRWCKKLNIALRKTNRGRSAVTHEDYLKIKEFFNQEDEEYLLPLDEPILPTFSLNKEEEPEILDFDTFQVDISNKDESLRAELLECYKIFNDLSLPTAQRLRARKRADNITS